MSSILIIIQAVLIILKVTGLLPNAINANSAYVLSFDISKVTLPPYRVARAYGNSVRLVRDL